MISEEMMGLPPTIDEITPEKGSGRRSSTGQMHLSVDGKKNVPHYLRASTGSCHDLCKYGRRQETETKPWNSASRRKKIEGKPSEKIATEAVCKFGRVQETETKPWSSASRRKTIEGKTPEKFATSAEGSSDRKNYLKVKSKSSDAKRRLPDSSSGGQQKVSTFKGGTLGSNEGKSKPASKHKSPAPTRLSDPGKTVNEKGLPRLTVSELVLPTKSPTHSNSKADVTKPTPSSKSTPLLGLRKEDQNMVEIKGIASRISVKDAVISSTSSIPSKSSGVSVQTSIKRQVQRQKTVIGQTNKKVAEERGIQQVEEEVPEKKLYVMDMKKNDKSMNFDESSFNMGVQSPTSSQSIVESSAQQDHSAILSHAQENEEMEISHVHSEEREEIEASYSEEREVTEKSHVQFSSQEVDDYKNDEEDSDEDEEGSEYPGNESDVYSNTEPDENENTEKEVGSNGDSIRRGPRKEWIVHPKGTDGDPVKLRFRRGRVVEIQPVDNVPRRLKFRRGRSPGDSKARAGTQQRTSLKKREITVDNDNNHCSEKHALRHSDVQGKKDTQGLFNDVIEETASKLVEARNSKVKALVGAFETVISLQEDGKPSATDEEAN